MSNTAGPAPMDAEFWNTGGGQAWSGLEALLDRLYRPVADAVLDRADPGPGGRVLDIGCGTGDTTIEMARRLGPDGRCLGVDVSTPLLRLAQDKAGAAGAVNAEFVLGDAQTLDLGQGGFDAVMSRFGVMFFNDSPTAFKNLRRTLKPGGKLVFACWRSPQDNPLTLVPMQAAAPLLSESPPPPSSDGPGRFAFADPAKVRAILEQSGWADIRIAPLDAPSPLSLDELTAISLGIGSLGPLMRTETLEAQARIRAAVETRLADYVVDGMVPMVSACWLVEAAATMMPAAP